MAMILIMVMMMRMMMTMIVISMLIMMMLGAAIMLPKAPLGGPRRGRPGGGICNKIVTLVEAPLLYFGKPPGVRLDRGSVLSCS